MASTRSWVDAATSADPDGFVLAKTKWHGNRSRSPPRERERTKASKGQAKKKKKKPPASSSASYPVSGTGNDALFEASW